MHKHVDNQINEMFPVQFEIEQGFVDPEAIKAGKPINLPYEQNSLNSIRNMMFNVMMSQ